MAAPKLVMQGPSIRTLVNQAIKEFMPIAGRKLISTARRKFGHRQFGWDPLAASTLRKKRKSLRRMGKRNAPWMRFSAPLSENPLIDKGKLANSLRMQSKSSSVTVSADFPMVQHEQDREVGDYRIPATIPLPARPVLGPALNESLDPITQELESFIGSRL